jgi:hypothetical protein
VASSEFRLTQSRQRHIQAECSAGVKGQGRPPRSDASALTLNLRFAPELLNLKNHERMETLLKVPAFNGYVARKK